MKKKKLLEMFIALEREVAELETALSKKDDEIIPSNKICYDFWSGNSWCNSTGI